MLSKLAYFIAQEPFLVLALFPLVWIQRWWSFPVLLIIVTSWVLRRGLTGRWSVPTVFDGLVLLLLTWLPFTLFTVVLWDEARTRYLILLYGLAVLFAVANGRFQGPPLGVVRQLFIGLDSLVLFVGLVGTDWLESKAPYLEALYSRLPLLIHGLRGTDRGGIHPNELAGLLSLLIPIGVATVFVRGNRALRTVTGLLLSLNAVMLFLTQSRSGILAVSAGLALVLAWGFILHASPSQRRRGTAIWVATMFPFIVLGYLLFVTWAGNARDAALNTFPSRVELWDRALTIISDYPVTGIGLGQFSTVLNKMYPLFAAPPDIVVPHAHNLFLQTAVDLGIPGASLVVALFAAACRSLILTYRQGADDLGYQAAAVGLLAGLVAFLLFGVTDAIAIGARGLLPVWVVLGMAAWLKNSAVVLTVDVQPDIRRDTGSEEVFKVV